MEYSPYSRRAFIKFDLSSIPSGSVIISATLKLYVSTLNYPSDGQVELHRVTSDWSESGATWNNQPSYDSAITASKACSEISDDSWVEFDVTSDVQAWVNGTYDNYGWAILRPGVSSSTAYIGFDSREGTNKPQLIVEYVEPNTVTVTTTETVTETVTETAYVTTVTDTVNTTVTETVTETITQTDTVTTTITDYVTETQTTTVTQTDTVYTTETAYTTQTVTTTQTITDVITETATTTITQTEWANQTVTVTTTMTPTTTVTIWANETVTMTEYGNSTAYQSVDYQALANALMPIVMVVGVICTMLGLILSATSGRRGG